MKSSLSLRERFGAILVELGSMESPIAHGLMFHHFHSEVHPRGQGSISGDDFRAMIEFSGPGNILCAQEWFDRAQAGTLQPNHLCLTFDDNLLCQYDVAGPVMKEYGLTAFFFVYTSVLHGERVALEIFRYFRSTYDSIDSFYRDFFATIERSALHSKIEAGMRRYDSATFLSQFPFYTEDDKRLRFIRDDILTQGEYESLMYEVMESRGFQPDEIAAKLWMTSEHLKKLRDDGHIIGLHSYSHPTRMGSLSADEQTREYTANARDITTLLGSPPVAMSHPCNSYSDETPAVLEGLGIELGFRADMEKVRANRFEYPRIDHAIVMSRMSEVHV